ncbi:HlyD family secretion protein [Methylobacterium sp. Leaf88]|uniref:HlyD family secretion protein n=1 Tax=Methylobacterium sp. Leaf88 TaxID=1736244 RepID=UPI0012E75FF7|nr:HlyD family secretion protein [Methylobacterium sp. Leaf88]
MTPAVIAPPKGEARVKPRRTRNVVLATLLLAALGGGAYKAQAWWTVGRFFVSTDDAYVQADISVLAAKIPGYLAAVPVVNGQMMHRGDVIARIDDGDYRLAAQAAHDKLVTQQAAIARIARQVEAAQAQMLQASAQIDANRADAVRATADYARQQQLEKVDFVAKARIEQARADRDRTDAAVKGAEAALVAMRANVEVLRAQGKEAEGLAAELRTAEARAARDLDFTTIRAPFDGVIGNKAAEAGAYVSPGSRIAALVPLESVRIDANFKETQVERMHPGQRVHIAVDAYPDRDIVGEVESLSPASGSVFSLLPPDNATGNFTKIVQRLPVRVHVPADVARAGLLRPGLSVTVRVDTRENAETAAGDDRLRTAARH